MVDAGQKREFERGPNATTTSECDGTWQRDLDASYAAAQVVVAWLHDIEVMSVTLRPEPAAAGDRTIAGGSWVTFPDSFAVVPPSGFCRPSIRGFFEDGPTPQADDARARIAVRVAGSAALRRRGMSRECAMTTGPAVDDFRRARELARACRGDRPASTCVWDTRADVDLLLSDGRVWGGVSALADRLADGAVLDGHDAVRLIESAAGGRLSVADVVPTQHPQRSRPSWVEIEDEDLIYHEAGHAVMALACGLEVVDVSLTPDFKRGWKGWVSLPYRGVIDDLRVGACCATRLMTSRERRSAEESVLISVAGLACAQTRLRLAGLLCDGQARESRSGARTDWRNAYRVARALAGDMRGARLLVEELRREAQEIFVNARIWAAVEEVAAHLTVGRVYEGKVVSGLYKNCECDRVRNPWQSAEDRLRRTGYLPLKFEPIHDVDRLFDRSRVNRAA